jgi:serine protease Do
MMTTIAPRGEQPPKRSRSQFISKLIVGVSLTALIAGVALPQFANSAALSITPPAQTQTANLPDFTSLVAKVKPAVFAVKVRIDPALQTAHENGRQMTPSPFQGENPFKGTPFEHFFDGMPFQFRGNPYGNGNGHHHGPMIQALGSGFFISSDGYAVTNNHVVDGATKVEIAMDDGETYKAKVVGTDPKTDLAVIKVEGGSNFPYVKLAKKTPKIGEWVLAVGNPFGLGGTVTAGIVSAENRDIGSGPYDDFIQIDAAVNRGNSGGPTFNLAGEVIGVNTAIYTPSGGSVGIAFDIPSTTVNQVVPILREKGHVDRAWLGVQIQTVTEDIAQSLGLSDAKGALVAEPETGSPAAKAGLKAGDVIVKVNGKDVEDARDLARKIGSMAPETRADIAVVRNGETKDFKVTLGAQKTNQQQTLAQNEEGNQDLGKLGLSVAPASSVMGAGEEGVVVTGVDPGGPAADVGIETGDVILKIGGHDVRTGQDLRKALTNAKARGRNKALALIKRGDGQHYVALPAAA